MQLQNGITDLEERKQKEVYAIRFQKKTDFKDRRESKSEIDIERDHECGVCLEVKAKVVLPNCCHQMCLKCYRDWYSSPIASFHFAIHLRFFLVIFVYYADHIFYIKHISSRMKYRQKKYLKS